MRLMWLPVVTLGCCLSSLQSAAQSASPPRYRVLHTNELDTLQKELAAVSQEGYRVIAGDAGLRVLILERSPARHEYLVAEPVDQALRKGEIPPGYQVLPHTLGSSALVPVSAVFEKAPSDERPRDYRTTDPLRTGSPQREILQAAADGYKVLGIHGADPGWLAIMERPGGSPAAPSAESGHKTDESSKDYSPPFLVLTTRKTGRMQKELNAAASNGFRLVSGAASQGSERRNEIMYALEKQARDAPKPEYLLLATGKRSTLEREMNEAAGRGFRLHPRSMATVARMIGTEIVTVMEKARSPEPLHYKVLGTKRIEALEKELGDAAADGYELAAFRIRGQEPIAVMQRGLAIDESDVQAAIDLARKQRVKPYDLRVSLEAVGYVYTPFIRVALAAQAAFDANKPFTPSDVSPEMLAPVVLIQAPRYWHHWSGVETEYYTSPGGTVELTPQDVVVLEGSGAVARQPIATSGPEPWFQADDVGYRAVVFVFPLAVMSTGNEILIVYQEEPRERIECRFRVDLRKWR
jgi:hypothetical protein